MPKKKPITFKVGDRVAKKLSDDETGQEIYLYAGVIFSEARKDPLSNEDKVYVTWDDAYKKPNPSEVVVSEIDLEENVKTLASKLEDEFNVYADQILVKVEAAAKLLLEANKIAKKAGLDGLSEMYEATDPLYGAMDKCGWRTSSFGC